MYILHSINTWIVFPIILLLFIVFFITTVRVAKLRAALCYINGEIRRTRGSERAYWEREKKRIIRAFILFRPIR